jgi:hypothetical protein
MYVTFLTGNRLRYIILQHQVMNHHVYSLSDRNAIFTLPFVCGWAGRKRQFKTNNNRKWEMRTITNNILEQQIYYHLISSTDSISQLFVCICPDLNVLITQDIFMKLRTCHWNTVFIYFNSQSLDTSWTQSPCKFLRCVQF